MTPDLPLLAGDPPWNRLILPIPAGRHWPAGGQSLPVFHGQARRSFPISFAEPPAAPGGL